MRRLLRSLMAWTILGENEQQPPDAPQGANTTTRQMPQTKQQQYLQSDHLDRPADMSVFFANFWILLHHQ